MGRKRQYINNDNDNNNNNNNNTTLMVTDKKNNRCQITDVAIPEDGTVRKKEDEKV